MSSRPSMSGNPGKSEDLDQDVCSVYQCNAESSMYAFGVPVCDWHWGIVCNRSEVLRAQALKLLLPRRDQHHIKTGTR